MSSAKYWVKEEPKCHVTIQPVTVHIQIIEDEGIPKKGPLQVKCEGEKSCAFRHDVNTCPTIDRLLAQSQWKSP